MQDKLEDYLGVRLQDVGDNWKARCPFHEDKTPSFFIHKEDLLCHCFGCGIAGRADLLIAKRNKLSVQEVRAELNISELLLNSQRETLVRDTPEYFPSSWLAPWKRISSHPYLEQRGLTPDTIEAFESRWDPATNRVVFPLKHNDKVYGAAGRATYDTPAKWFFYWRCRKSLHVYRATPPDFSSPLVVVEGIFDAMWLYQAGYTNVVALMGSKASKEQIAEIKASADEVILGLDNDTAGLEGSYALHKALRDSCRVHYVSWASCPEANDLMDMTEDQLHQAVNKTKTPLEIHLARA